MRVAGMAAGVAAAAAGLFAAPAGAVCFDSLIAGDTCGEAPVLRERFRETARTSNAIDRYDIGVITTCAIPSEGAGQGPDVVYHVVPQGDGDMRIAYTPDGWNSAIYVVRDCGNLNNTCLASAQGVGPVTLDVPVEAGKSYYIIVDGAFGDQGCYEIDVTPPPPGPGAPFATEGGCEGGLRMDENAPNGVWTFLPESDLLPLPSLSSVVQLLTPPAQPYRLDRICIRMREGFPEIFDYELVVHANDGGTPGALLAATPLRASGIPDSGGAWFSGSLMHLPVAARTIGANGAFVGLRWDARGQGIVLARDAGPITIVDPAQPVFAYRDNGAFAPALDTLPDTRAVYIRASGVYTGGGLGTVDCDGGITAVDPATGNQGNQLLLAYRDPLLGPGQNGGQVQFNIVAPPGAERLRVLRNGQEGGVFSPVPLDDAYSTLPSPFVILDPDRDTNRFEYYFQSLFAGPPAAYLEGAPCVFNLGWQRPVVQLLPFPATPVVGGQFSLVVQARNLRYDPVAGNFGVLDSNAPGWPGPVPLLPEQVQSVDLQGNATFVDVFDTFDFQPDLYGVYTVTVSGPGVAVTETATLSIVEGGEILRDAISIGRTQASFIGRVDAAAAGQTLCPGLWVGDQLVATGDCVPFADPGHAHRFTLDYPEDAVPPGAVATFTLGQTACVAAPALGAAYSVRHGETRGADRCDVSNPFTGGFRLGDTTVGRADFYQIKNACGGLSVLAGIGPEAVYHLALPFNAAVTVNVQPEPGFDAVIYVVRDCENPAGTCVVAADQMNAGFQENAAFDARADRTYAILVDGYNGNAGAFQITVNATPSDHPLATQQYDDGHLENNYWPGPNAAAGFISRFHSEGEPGGFTELFVPLSRSGSKSAVDLEVVFVREDAGNPGNPGAIYQRRTYPVAGIPSQPARAWYTLDLRPMLDADDGQPDFIGVLWDGSDGQAIVIGADESPGTAPHAGYRTQDNGATWVSVASLFNDFRALGLRANYTRRPVEACLDGAIAGDPAFDFDDWDGGFPADGAPDIVRRFDLGVDPDPIGGFRWWAFTGGPTAPLIPCDPGNPEIIVTVYADDAGEPGAVLRQEIVVAQAVPTGRTRAIPNGPAVEYRVDAALAAPLPVSAGWVGFHQAAAAPCTLWIFHRQGDADDARRTPDSGDTWTPVNRSPALCVARWCGDDPVGPGDRVQLAAPAASAPRLPVGALGTVVCVVDLNGDEQAVVDWDDYACGGVRDVSSVDCALGPETDAEAYVPLDAVRRVCAVSPPIDGEGEGEGTPEGEGEGEGTPEGEGEGTPEGEGEGTLEGEGEGTPEGEGEGTPEGEGEGTPEGEGEGTPEGEGEGTPEGEGEGGVDPVHSTDQNGDGLVSLSELLRLIQFYNSLRFGCEAGTEDGYAPGATDESCPPHAADYNPQDWQIALTELLRVIQFYNSGGYYACPGQGTEDGYCVGQP